ncbi:MAG: hypothetical protein RJA49_2178 [Actinomycetota bacterium]
MRRTSRLLLSAIALLGVLGASCGSDDPGSGVTTPRSDPGATGKVVVFAASSLTEAFNEMGTAFKDANPDANVTFNFAGSGDLVTQIGQGAPADVFVSADDSNMKKLTDAGEAAGDPVSIAKNTFQVIVEKGNPKGVTGVADLAKPDLIVVLCADTVPCGKGAAKILENANVTVTPKSYEDKVKGVVTKVTTGEADAGIVFVTDVKAAGDSASGVAIPAGINVISNYPMVITKEATNATAAQSFIDFVASPAGQAILAKYGFLAP